ALRNQAAADSMRSARTLLAMIELGAGLGGEAGAGSLGRGGGGSSGGGSGGDVGDRSGGSGSTGIGGDAEMVQAVDDLCGFAAQAGASAGGSSSGGAPPSTMQRACDAVVGLARQAKGQRGPERACTLVDALEHLALAWATLDQLGEAAGPAAPAVLTVLCLLVRNYDEDV
ncbi:MAG: hypothetical protein J3K34DRAFT_390897, partial [Monoraphidium minutum]